MWYLPDPVTARPSQFGQIQARAMSETKVSELSSKIRQQFSLNRGTFMRAFEWYHATYIKPGRIAPVIHIAVLAGTIGYIIEYPHLKHEIAHAKEAAKKI